MKKTMALALSALLMLGLLAACGGNGGNGGTGSTTDYKAVIEAARDAEINESPMYSVVTGPEDQQYNLVFYEGSPFNADAMERYALSISGIIIKAYGVAIILPKQGQQQAVLDQVNAFVEQQKKAQENYLPDQYAIASSAIVKTVPTGEVILVMSEDAETVAAAIEAGLKG